MLLIDLPHTCALQCISTGQILRMISAQVVESNISIVHYVRSEWTYANFLNFHQFYHQSSQLPVYEWKKLIKRNMVNKCCFCLGMLCLLMRWHIVSLEFGTCSNILISLMFVSCLTRSQRWKQISPLHFSLKLLSVTGCVHRLSFLSLTECHHNDSFSTLPFLWYR